MLQFVTLFGALALAVAAPQHSIFRFDLDPEVAAKYINNPPFTAPQLSGRTAVLPLVKYNDPRFRSADAGPTLGHYWKNGKEIDNTDDYVEEVYNAAQYHGQDGLGAYAYGYETPESSKVENKQRSGDVAGSYTFKAGSSNDLIKVRYWADSQGFHQEDNIPKVVLKPVEEAPEVRAARVAHEKAWQEAAYANLHPGDAAANAAAANPGLPQNNYNNYNPNYDYQTGASEQQGAFALPPSQLREGRAYEQNPGQYNQGSVNQNSYQTPNQNAYQNPNQNSYQNPNQNSYQNPNQNQAQQYTTTTTTTEEPTGPPRGFFYSFEYPVSIIVPKNEQNNAGNPGYPVDKDTVGVDRYQ